MSDNNGDIKNGAMTLKKDIELVEFILENAEMEYLNTEGFEGRIIELQNGVVFYFGKGNELINIGVE